MTKSENTNPDRVGLEKLKAYLDRSNLEYTEERQGNATIMEIKPRQREDEPKKALPEKKDDEVLH